MELKETFSNVVDQAFMQAGTQALDEADKSDMWTKTPGTAVAKKLGSGQAVHWYYVNYKGEKLDSSELKFQRTLHGLCQWFTYVHYMADHGDVRAKKTAESFVENDEVGNDIKILNYVFGSSRKHLKKLVDDLLYKENIKEWFNHGQAKKFKITAEQLDELYGNYTADKYGKRQKIPLVVSKKIFRDAIEDAFREH